MRLRNMEYFEQPQRREGIISRRERREHKEERRPIIVPPGTKIGPPVSLRSLRSLRLILPDGLGLIPRKVEAEVIERALAKARGEKLVRKEIEAGMSSTAAFKKYGIL